MSVSEDLAGGPWREACLGGRGLRAGDAVEGRAENGERAGEDGVGGMGLGLAGVDATATDARAKAQHFTQPFCADKPLSGSDKSK